MNSEPDPLHAHLAQVTGVRRGPAEYAVAAAWLLPAVGYAPAALVDEPVALIHEP
ncbi:hypothetical protein ACIP5Y_08050 [Nocardia sp. NPDC088792]|uniref:hypothetical protein n=1 Tax=Nocardia sp. NPDC088792 TaxID=3364332 RepID=UPI003801F195